MKKREKTASSEAEKIILESHSIFSKREKTAGKKQQV